MRQKTFVVRMKWVKGYFYWQHVTEQTCSTRRIKNGLVKPTEKAARQASGTLKVFVVHLQTE